MAGSDLSQGTPVQSNSTKLDRHLEETYNMPTPQWWESVAHAFAQLQELACPTSSVDLGHELAEPVDEYSASARLARATSLPSITLLPAGNHALKLAATNEVLQCLAFGTVGRKRYVELLWESIAQAQQAGAAKVVVHEVLQGVIPQITLRIGVHMFELRYLQCEPLVRTCVPIRSECVVSANIDTATRA